MTKNLQNLVQMAPEILSWPMFISSDGKCYRHGHKPPERALRGQTRN